MAAPASIDQQFRNMTDLAGNLKVAVQSGGGGGGAVTIADGADVAEGATSSPAYGGGGNASAIAILKGLYALIAQASGLPNAVTTGQGILGVGGWDTNSPQELQALQIGAYGEAQVGLASTLDFTKNDTIGNIPSHGFPSQQKAAWVSGTTISVPLAPAVAPSLAPLAGQLGLPGMPNIAPLQWVRLAISNNGTAKNLTGFQLVFSMTVDGTTDSITYTYPFTLTHASGSVVRYWMPILESVGIYNSCTLVCTFAPTPAAGYVQVQTTWGFSPITAWPPEWQFDKTVNVTDSSNHDVVAAPPAGTRLVLEEFFAVNSSTTVASDLSLTEGSGGTVRSKGMVYANGLGWRRGPTAAGRGIKWPAATAISVIAGTTGSNINANAIGHYEPV